MTNLPCRKTKFHFLLPVNMDLWLVTHFFGEKANLRLNENKKDFHGKNKMFALNNLRHLSFCNIKSKIFCVS